MKEAFSTNHRLRWAFKICKELGIDDPVHWMNSVSPSILDQWIAYELNESDIAPKAMAEARSPEAAMEYIKSFGK